MKRVEIWISLIVVGVMSVSGISRAYAEESLDPIFDSIMTQQEEQYDPDAYYEELAKLYGGKDYERIKALQERLGGDEKRLAAAAAKRKTQRRLAFFISLFMALYPTVVIVKQVIKGELKPAGVAAIWRTVGVMLFYGVVIFALNYAWLWTMFTGQTKIMGLVLGLFLLAFVIYALYTLHSSPNKDDHTLPHYAQEDAV